MLIFRSENKRNMKKYSLIILLIVLLLPLVASAQQYGLKVTLTHRKWCSVSGCYPGWDGTIYFGPNNTGGTYFASYYLPEVSFQTEFYYYRDEPFAGQWANTRISPH